MAQSKTILNKYLVVVPEKFAISVKVIEVPRSDKKHPEGVKTSFVLLDLELGKSVFLIDNHAPFGFHMHTGMPENKERRQKLNIRSYQEAYNVFMVEVDQRVKEYKSKN